MRKKIYEIIEPAKENAKPLSVLYDSFMVLVILVSIVPLCFKSNSQSLTAADFICFVIFTVDYVLHFITADFKYGKKI